jgi:hypothetical protein
MFEKTHIYNVEKIQKDNVYQKCKFHVLLFLLLTTYSSISIYLFYY